MYLVGSTSSWSGVVNPSESLTFKLRAGLRGSGHVNVEHLLIDRWRCAGRTSHPMVQALSRVGLVPRWVLLLSSDQRNFESGSSSCSGPGVSLWLKALQPDRVFGVTGTRKQDGYVFTELRAESKVDEGVVETGRLGKEAGEDASEVWHMEATGRPHGHHGVWRPGQDEGCTDHYGNLEETGSTDYLITKTLNYKLLNLTSTQDLIVC